MRSDCYVRESGCGEGLSAILSLPGKFLASHPATALALVGEPVRLPLDSHGRLVGRDHLGQGHSRRVQVRSLGESWPAPPHPVGKRFLMILVGIELGYGFGGSWGLFPQSIPR